MIRPLDPASDDEIELVARRMRATLVEVLGEDRGKGMYTHEQVVDRVREHLDPTRLTGQVFVYEVEAAITGHVIVRVDDDGAGNSIGLFGTIYVAPEARNRGIARALIARGEQWMRDQRLPTAATYTDRNNEKLHRLFRAAGYTLSRCRAIS